MKRTSITAGAIVLILLSLSLVSEARAQTKVAYVDLRKALNETEEGRKAMEHLSRMKDDLQKKINEREQAIMKMKGEIEKQQNVLTKEALQKRVQEYYQAVTELQQNYTQFQRDLVKKEAEATKTILEKMRAIISRMGKSDNYLMIMDISSGAVAWAPSHMDLTDKLIQQYNKENPLKKGK